MSLGWLYDCLWWVERARSCLSVHLPAFTAALSGPSSQAGDIMSTLLTQHPTPGQSQVLLLPNSPSSYPLISVSHNFSLFQLVLDKFWDFFCLTFATYVDLGQHLLHLLHLLQHLHLYSPQHRNKCDIVSGK